MSELKYFRCPKCTCFTLICSKIDDETLLFTCQQMYSCKFSAREMISDLLVKSPSINPNVLSFVYECVGCSHLIIKVGGTFFHHLYMNKCDCMCDTVMNNEIDRIARSL